MKIIKKNENNEINDNKNIKVELDTKEKEEVDELMNETKKKKE